MQAIILAGGKGTRLLPYTKKIPKPLLPIDDIPIIEIIIRQLKVHGFDTIILAVGHMHHLFQSFFEDGSKFGVKISYTVESKPLGTAGALSKCFSKLDENFLMMNGDILTTLDFQNLMNFHIKESSDFTIATHNRTVKIDYGVLESDNSKNLLRYIEKPHYDYMVSMGINIVNKSSIKKYIRKEKYLDIPDLVKELIKYKSKILCYKETCDWLDIGRVDDYEKASSVFLRNKNKYLID